MAGHVSVSYVLGRFLWFLYAWCTVWLGLSLILSKPICVNGCHLTVGSDKCSAVIDNGNSFDESGLRLCERFSKSSWLPIGTDYLNHAPRSTVTTTDAGMSLDLTMAGDLSAESPNSVHKAVLWLRIGFNPLDDLCLESTYSAHTALLWLPEDFESWIDQKQLRALFVLVMNLTITWTSSQRTFWSPFHAVERQRLISCNTEFGVGCAILLLPNVSSVLQAENTNSFKTAVKTDSWKYISEDLGSLCVEGSALLNRCFHHSNGCQHAIFASSLGKPESRVTEQILRAYYGRPSFLDEETDCRMLMSICLYPSHPNDICLSMNLIGAAELCIGYCSNCRIENCRGLYWRANSHKLGKVPVQEPPISSKLAFKIFLIALMSIVALCMRAVRQERLLQVVKVRSWQVCNYAVVLQSSPSTVCMKTCSTSNWFEHSFHDGCVGSKDRGITHNRHGSLKWKICVLIMKFVSYVFHVFLLLTNFRLEVTHSLSDVKVSEYYNAVRKAGAKLPSSSKAQPKTQPSEEDDRVKGFCKNRMEVTSQNFSLHKQGREDGLSPSVMPRLLIPVDASIVDETCSSESEIPLLKDLQWPDDHEVLSLKGMEKRKRRKRRSKLSTLKHGGEEDCQSCSTSPCLPASPAAPLSSRHLRSDCVAHISFGGVVRFPNSPKNADSSTAPSQLDVTHRMARNRTSLAPGAHLHGIKPKVVNALVETPTVVNPRLLLNGCQRAVLDGKGNKNITVENWASVARRAVAACETTRPLQCQTSVPEPEKAGGDILRRPTLLPSATFPQAGCRSSHQEKVTYDGPSFPRSSLMVSSLARAPGSSRLLKKDDCQNFEQMTGSQSAEPVYDIWGDHFAEISQIRSWPSNCYCEQASAQRDNRIVASKQASWWYSCESFFAKPCFMMSDSCSTDYSTCISIDNSSGSSDSPKAQAEK